MSRATSVSRRSVHKHRPAAARMHPPSRDAELHGEHPGGLVDLGPVQCQVRGLPVQGRPVPPGRPPPESGRRAAARSRHRRRSARHRAGRPVSGPGRSRYRPSTPARIAPIRSGNAKIAAGADLTCRQREDRPAAPDGFRVSQVRGQDRAARGRDIEARALAQGQLKLGELLADLIGHAASRDPPRHRARHSPTRRLSSTAATADRAHIGDRHPAAAARRPATPPGPRPCPAATCHPRTRPRMEPARAAATPAAITRHEYAMALPSRCARCSPQARAHRSVSGGCLCSQPRPPRWHEGRTRHPYRSGTEAAAPAAAARPGPHRRRWTGPASVP